ncbi:MAG: HDIG domain-containing protein [bacterium]|nr:HDIG domain-containing protein [bacterium]
MRARWLREPGARYLFRDRGAASWVRLLWAGLTFALIVAFLMPALVPAKLQLEAGQVSPKDIWAPRTIADRYRTDSLRAAARAEVSDFYRLDPGVWLRADMSIASVFSGLAGLAAQGVEAGRKLEQARQLVGGELADSVLLAVLEASPGSRQDLEARVRETVGELLQAGIKPEYVETARKQAATELGVADLERNLRLFGAELARQVLEANMFFDEQETRRKGQEAADEIEPLRIIQGQVVVREGDVITEHQIAILGDLGLLQTTPAYPARVGVLVVAALLVASLAFYLKLFSPLVFGSNQRVLLLFVIMSGSIGLVWAAGSLSGYLVPVAVGSMLTTILLGPPAGVGVAVLLALLAGLGPGTHLLVALLGGLAGVYGVATLAQRSDLMRSGALVAGANVAAIFGLSLVGARSIAEVGFWLDHLWGIANGIFSAILTIGSLPFLENLFGIVTPLKLLELSNPNQPLLRRMLLEAPGTHHHSVMVANLAEAATERVGGEALLARVGAYYHDVGKIKRAYFFVENQLFGDENPHDKLSPNLSALIVTSHVRDGVELAQEENLPESLIDFIRQHHGTSLVTYFFHRATENGRDEPVMEQDFRYDGPIPDTRETAIVMLADACEAAVRALHRPNPARIEATVRRIIRERLDDGQLNQSDLTLRDLDAVAEEFTRLLTGFFHTRVQYPESMVGDLKEPDGGSGR